MQDVCFVLWFYYLIQYLSKEIEVQFCQSLKKLTPPAPPPPPPPNPLPPPHSPLQCQAEIHVQQSLIHQNRRTYRTASLAVTQPHNSFSVTLYYLHPVPTHPTCSTLPDFHPTLPQTSFSPHPTFLIPTQMHYFHPPLPRHVISTPSHILHPCPEI